MLKKIMLILAVILLSGRIAYADDYHVRVSSFMPGDGESVFDGKFLSDGNYTTGWIEKGDSDGAGEWLHFFFPAKVIVDSVTIRNGIGTGEDFNKVNRVQKVVVSFSGGQRQGFSLKDTPKLQQLKVADHPTTSLGFSIHSVYSSGEVGDAGISEVDISYHRPTAQELAAVTTGKTAVKTVGKAESKPSEQVRKLSEKEKEVLKEKMSKLEHKKAVLEELKVFFDRLYTNFVTISEEYPRMFTEDNFLRESAMFESFRSMLETRGVLQKYHEAVVSTSGLRYSIRTLTPNEVELWVKGEYSVIFDMRDNKVRENALYHLKKEYGEWKVKNKTEY